MMSLTPNKLELTAKEIFLRTVCPGASRPVCGCWNWVGCVFGALPACADARELSGVCRTCTPTVPAVVSVSAVTLDSGAGGVKMEWALLPRAGFLYSFVFGR